jgi:hypothetical protein
VAYLDIFDPYNLFPFLKGTETDLAAAVLRCKGIVLDSIVEDRLLAEASEDSEDQNLVEQLNLDKSQLGQLLLRPAQMISAETNQRIEALEGEVDKIENQLAKHVAGLGKVRHALGVSLEQVQASIPNDGALVEYVRYGHYLGKGKWETRYGAIVLFSRSEPHFQSFGVAGLHSPNRLSQTPSWNATLQLSPVFHSKNIGSITRNSTDRNRSPAS